MNALPLTLSVLLVLTAVLVSIFVLTWGPASGREKVRRLLVSRGDAVARQVRTMARVTLAARRRIRSMEAKRAEALERSRTLHRTLKERIPGLPIEIVFSDLQRPGDALYAVALEQTVPCPVDPFAGGTRTYLVWAVDEERASAKLATRFPEEKGYRIAGVSRRAALPPAPGDLRAA